MEITGQRITPSKIDPWTGTRQLAAMFTLEQEQAIDRMQGKIIRNRHSFNLPVAYVVTRKVMPVGEDRPVYWRHIVCPVTSCSRDRSQICVVAPIGDEQWVDWAR